VVKVDRQVLARMLAGDGGVRGVPTALSFNAYDTTRRRGAHRVLPRIDAVRQWLEMQSQRNLGRPPWSGPESPSKWCCYCDVELSLAYEGKQTATSRTRDHVVPRSRGGSEGPSNKVHCCSACNSAKGVLSLLEFLLVHPLMHPRVVDAALNRECF
jgi:5-methylcytosine-specific restriction endonuclease McrA